MSTAGERVWVALLADASVAAVVSTRVYPLELPQDATLPAIVYSDLGGPRAHSLAGDSGIGRARVQVDMYAATLDAANALAVLVRTCINAAFGVECPEPQRIRETELDRYRLTVDYVLDHGDDD